MKSISEIVPDAQHFDAVLVKGLQAAVTHTITITTMAARNEHDWRDRTYATRESLEPTVDDASNGATASLKAEGNAARLAEGTEPHVIEAKGRALRFPMGGMTIFRKRVNHPGTRPDAYLDNAAEKASEALVASVEAALDAAFG